MPTHNLIDISGKRYGRWTVIERVWPSAKPTKTWWRCRCDCGEVRNVCAQSLASNLTYLRMPEEGSSQDGKTRTVFRTSLYNSWCNMRRRCNPTTIL
jgi:hypothetical protein